jgi:hypothetical protein
MNAFQFDTLKLARDFEVAGLAPPVAAGIAAALADALIGADLVTKSDLVTRLSSLEARLESRLEILRRDMTIKLGGMLVIAVGVILAAMRFMPHP